MRTAIIAAGLAAAAAVGVTAPAEAQPYRHHGYYHRFHGYHHFYGRPYRYRHYGYRFHHRPFAYRHRFHRY